MVSINLKDAYLQIPIHPSSRRFLRFTARGRAWQFKELCFGLSMVPQVFTRVIAPVSSFLHQSGVRMLQYLDDWLNLASSRKDACWAREKVLSLCQALVYLGIKIESQQDWWLPEDGDWSAKKFG